jgi:hypothetical protein
MRTDVSARVGYLNPHWNVKATPQEVDKLFAKASDLVGGEFFERLDYYGNAWLPARDIVLAALESSWRADERVVTFREFAPWKVRIVVLDSFHSVECHPDLFL